MATGEVAILDTNEEGVKSKKEVYELDERESRRRHKEGLGSIYDVNDAGRCRVQMDLAEVNFGACEETAACGKEKQVLISSRREHVRLQEELVMKENTSRHSD